MSSIRHPGSAVHNPVGKLTAEHPGVVKIGRAGWFAKGVVYVLAGYLALAVAAKAGGWAKSPTTGDQEASPVGAVKTVAGSGGGGTVLLWLLAIGMLLYAAWRVVSALLPGGKDAKAMAHRIGYIASAVMYVTFAISAIALARHTPAPRTATHKVTDISASFMTHSFRPLRDRRGRRHRDCRRSVSRFQGRQDGCRRRTRHVGDFAYAPDGGPSASERSARWVAVSDSRLWASSSCDRR